MRIIIAGGRDFNNFNGLVKKMDLLVSQIEEDIEIVSGTAKGADLLGEKYANSKGYSIKQFPANWDKFGKGAGYKRNCEMANYADALVAFWDGSSRGTQHMINIARKKGIQVKVIRYKND